MSIELPPLYGTAHGYACEVVQARERILTERIAELEGEVEKLNWIILRDAIDAARGKV